MVLRPWIHIIVHHALCILYSFPNHCDFINDEVLSKILSNARRIVQMLAKSHCCHHSAECFTYTLNELHHWQHYFASEIISAYASMLDESMSLFSRSAEELLYNENMRVLTNCSCEQANHAQITA